jgi:hypothetical protein
VTPTDPDLVKLIGGPYRPPRLKIGDVGTCLYRDCDVVITSTSDARIPWPRCRARDQVGGGGSGLLIDQTLALAIRTESAEALKYWFGVGTHAVWSWRKAFGIGQRDTTGSQRLYDLTAEKAAAATRGKPLPASVRRKMRRASLARDAARSLRAYAEAHRRPWSETELALLGTMPDSRLARRLKRSRKDVRRERQASGIPRYQKPALPESLLSAEERERLRRERIRSAKLGKPRPPHVIEAMRQANRNRRPSAETRAKMSAAGKRRAAEGFVLHGRVWTADEDELVRTLPPAEVAARTARTISSVYSRRVALGVPDGRRRG